MIAEPDNFLFSPALIFAALVGIFTGLAFAFGILRAVAAAAPPRLPFARLGGAGLREIAVGLRFFTGLLFSGFFRSNSVFPGPVSLGRLGRPFALAAPAVIAGAAATP